MDPGQGHCSSPMSAMPTAHGTRPHPLQPAHAGRAGPLLPTAVSPHHHVSQQRVPTCRSPRAAFHLPRLQRGPIQPKTGLWSLQDPSARQGTSTGPRTWRQPPGTRSCLSAPELLPQGHSDKPPVPSGKPVLLNAFRASFTMLVLALASAGCSGPRAASQGPGGDARV